MDYDLAATSRAILAFRNAIAACVKVKPEEGATKHDVNVVAFKLADTVGDLLKRLAADGFAVNDENEDNAYQITRRVMPVCIAAEEMMNALVGVARSVLGPDGEQN